MKVFLYKNSSPPNKISKTLTNEIELNCRLVDDTSLEDVKLRVDFSSLEKIIGVNYMYIPLLKRYYYITERLANFESIIISTKSDPLMSFKSDILNSEQLIDRQEKKVNKWLKDTQAPITQKKSLIVKSFGEPFDTDINTFVLQTTGKG